MILMYHNIDEKSGFNTISIKNFREHLEYLTSENYHIVSIKEYVNNLEDKSKGKMLTITFDDAYVGVLHSVLPVIKQFEIPISVFVPVSFIGGYNVWDVQNGHDKINILSWEELKELKDEKWITIGSHGCNHKSLGKCNNDAIFKEINDSKQILERKLSIVIDYFAYPFGQLKDMNQYSERVLMEAGYKAALSTIWGRRNKTTSLFQLKRIEIGEKDTALTLKHKLNDKIDWHYYKQAVKNNLFRFGLRK